MIVDLGETWSSPVYEVRDTPITPGGTGNLADAGTVTWTITLPDGTSTAPTAASHPGTGSYTVDYPTVQEGLHQVTVTATGGTLGSLIREWRDSFTVEQVRLLVSVDDAIRHLRATDDITDPGDREQLRWFCQVATDSVERDLDLTLVPRTVTETLTGGKSALMLSHTPVLSITSVTELGTVLPGTGAYSFDAASGLLYRGAAGYGSRWSAGTFGIVVVYRAGLAVPPPCTRYAALGEVQRMWRSQQMPHPDLDGDYDAETAIRTAVGAPRSRILINAYDSLRMGTGA